MSTDACKHAIDYVLANEGGFVDNASDAGGATNHGISYRLLTSLTKDNLRRYGIFFDEDVLPHRVIRELTIEQAQLIYEGEFWNKARFGEIMNRHIRDYVFDFCVLYGISMGIKILQRSCWANICGLRTTLIDDGKLGDVTLDVVNTAEIKTVIEVALRAECAGYCRMLAALNPKNEMFLEGWLNRCYRWG